MEIAFWRGGCGSMDAGGAVASHLAFDAEGASQTITQGPVTSIVGRHRVRHTGQSRERLQRFHS